MDCTYLEMLEDENRMRASDVSVSGVACLNEVALKLLLLLLLYEAVQA